MTRCLGLLVALFLVVPASADAARAFTLGSGFSPNVAVANDGTAHFVWYEERGDVDRLRYCQVPRGQNDCEKTQTFDGTGDAPYRDHRAFVFMNGSGSEVFLLASYSRNEPAGHRFDHLAYRSTDGGKTFGEPVQIGDPDRQGPGDAVTDGTSLGLITDEGYFTLTSLFGPAVPDQSLPLGTLLDPRRPLADPSIGLAPGTEPVVTFDDLRRTLVFHTPDHTLARAQVFGFWSMAPSLDNDVQAELASGPKGLYAMLIRTKGGVCPCHYVFRRWDGTKFESAYTKIKDFRGTGGSTGANHQLFQDAEGRLHTVWTKTDGGRATDPTDLRYARSSGGEADFGKPRSLVERLKTVPIDLQVATADDGKGFLVWAESPKGRDTRLRAVAVGPAAK